MHERIIIANWKMQLSLNSAHLLAQQYVDQLTSSEAKNCRIILCPSFEALSTVGKIIESKQELSLSAQDCSAYEKGAYTGQVSALSLAQIGCRYCIIGHSECRITGQTNMAIGTGKVPDGAYLTDVFAWLNDFVSKTGSLPYYLLYGGSVTSDTAKALWDIPNNNGLLVGNASLDFQKFKNIVSWCS